jgi:hypothetical protein
MLPRASRAAENSAAKALHYTLEVSFDIRGSVLKGVATIPVKKGQEVKLRTGTLHLVRISLDKEEMRISGGDKTLSIIPAREGNLEIRYEGIFREPDPGMNREQPQSEISAKGIFLTGLWYPRPEQTCEYHLTALLPDGYEAVSEAEEIEKTAKDDRTVFKDLP